MLMNTGCQLVDGEDLIILIRCWCVWTDEAACENRRLVHSNRRPGLGLVGSVHAAAANRQPFGHSEDLQRDR